MEIIAHRGASHDAPENTLAAVRLGWEQGADAVEVDVHLTHDGRLAVIHDDDARRTGGTARRVGDATLAELQRIDVGRWKAASFAGETIPALADVVALTPPGKRLFIELKGGPELVPELVRSAEAAGRDASARGVFVRPAIITFNFPAAKAAKQALPDHEVCWLAETGPEAPAAGLAEIADIARAAGLDGVDLDWQWRLDGKTLQQIRRNGFKVYVWTVDDPAVARQLAALGIDGLTTNRPGWLRAQLARR